MTPDTCRAAVAQAYVDGLTIGLLVMLLIAAVLSFVAYEAIRERRRILRYSPGAALRLTLWHSEDP